MPLIRPIRPENRMHTMMVMITGTPKFFIRMPISRPESAMLEPTDRSMPPEMMTKVMPTATTKFSAICWNTFRKLLAVKNTGEAMARSRHSAASAIRMPRTLPEEPSFFTPCLAFFFCLYAE